MDDYYNMSIQLLNIKGQRIRSIVLGANQQGWHRENINKLLPETLASGIYFIQMHGENLISPSYKVTLLSK